MRRVVLAKLLDRDRRLEAQEAEDLVRDLRQSPEAAGRLKDQLLMDELLGRMLVPERRGFAERVVHAIEGSGADRFIERTAEAIRKSGGDPHEPAGAPTGRHRLAIRFWTFGLASGLVAAAAIFVVRGRAPLDGNLASAPELAQGESAPAVETLPAHPAAGRMPEFAAVRLTEARGSVLVVGGAGSGPARPGATIEPGGTLVTSGQDGAAVLTTTDGVGLRLDTESVLSVHAPEAARSVAGFFIARGRLLVRRVAPRPAGSPVVRVASPHARFETETARFALSVENERTRLSVDAGLVHFVRAGETRRRAVGPGQHALLGQSTEVVAGSGASRGVAIVLSGPDEAVVQDPSDRIHRGDKAMRARLQSLGFEASIVSQGELSEWQARAARLLILSSSVGSLDTATSFREVPVPVVVCEANLYDDMGMTAPCDDGGCGLAQAGQLWIKDGAHPMAARMTQGVRLRHNTYMVVSWGQPTLHAAWIATIPGNPTQAAIFSYEKGAAMVGLPAPARRVGLFFRQGGATSVTDAGWSLFDAAVLWAAESPQD